METERKEIARRVMKALRHSSARRPLTATDDWGVHKVVICLATDTIEYATQQVVAAGGHATVVIPTSRGLLPLGWEIDAHNSQQGLFDPGPPLHPHSELGMLVAYMECRDTEARMTFHVSTGYGDVGVREHDRITVPA